MFGFSYSSSKLKVQKPTRIVIEKSSCAYCIFNGDESLTTFDRVSFTPLGESRINTKCPHPLKNLHLKIKINMLRSWRCSWQLILLLYYVPLFIRGSILLVKFKYLTTTFVKVISQKKGWILSQLGLLHIGLGRLRKGL